MAARSNTYSVEGTIGVYCVCPSCGGGNTVENVPIGGITDWKGGEPIQGALPDLTPNEREMLMTGICPECWDKMFADGEAEEWFLVDRRYLREET